MKLIVFFAVFFVTVMVHAATKYSAEEQFNLGHAYLSGTGVPTNYSRAHEWFHKAALQGLSKAQYNLGLMFERGLGVPKDQEEAQRWLKLSKVAAQGQPVEKNALIRSQDFLAGKPKEQQNYVAGFDCRKASTKIEKMICSDKDLSLLDARLMSLYNGKLSYTLKPKEYKKSQKDWLKIKRNICQDQLCLKIAYQARLLELEEIQPESSIEPKILKEISRACYDFTKNPTTFKNVVTNKLNAQDWFKFDSDEDGTAEDFVYSDSGGTCHRTSFGIIDGNKIKDLLFINSKVDGYVWDMDIHAVSNENKLYAVMSFRGQDRLFGLAEVSKKGFTALCEFKKKVIQISKVENDSSACGRLSSGDFVRMNPEDKKNKINLKRDGSEIKYTEQKYESSAGCGCSYRNFTAQSSNQADQNFTSKFNELVGTSVGCDSDKLKRDWVFARISNKDYLLAENSEIRIGSLFEARFNIQPQELFEWDGTSFIKTCSSDYKYEVIPMAPDLE
jgi:uncharacterized protein